MRRMLAAIAGAICACSSAFARHADSIVSPPAPDHRTIERDVRAESRGYCLTLAIYFEGGSTFEPEVGQRHIARVIHERARANLRKWGGSDICDVVFYMSKGVCQFSFTCLPLARRTPGFGGAWQRARLIAEEELQGTNDVEERSIRYYMNTALTPPRNACRFRKEFVKVVDAGRHEFFREPTWKSGRSLPAVDLKSASGMLSNSERRRSGESGLPR